MPGQAADAPCHVEAAWGNVESYSHNAYVGSKHSDPHPAYTSYDLTFHLRDGSDVTEPVPEGLDGAALPMNHVYTLTIWQGHVTQIRDGDELAEPLEMRDSPVMARHLNGLMAVIFTALLAGAVVYWKYFDKDSDV